MSSEKAKLGAARMPETPAGEAPHDPKLNRLAQTRIGDQLRSMYDELLVQPVPDRFKDLLQKLDATGEQKSK